jgi:hypothetical protein
MDRRERLLEVVRHLDAWSTERGWRGTDPYEGLNATRLVGPLRRRRRGRQLVAQAVKRSPLDLRPVLGIPVHPNAASVAWMVSTYSLGGFLKPAEARDKLARTLRLLRELRCPGYPEPSWGYHFDMQSRVLFRPRTEPNTIATAYAGMALLDAHATTSDPGLLEDAREAGRFFLRHVPATETASGVFFGYAPGDRTPVHNANMHVAALLARLAVLTPGDADGFGSAARAAVRYTLSHQRPDGSWPYGERSDLAWIDNFHTGYVLDSLRTCIDAGIDGGVKGAWALGLDFYRRELFLPDGTPKYTSSSIYPIDAQCVAQGIQTFSIAARHEEGFAEAAWRVFDFAMARMRRRDGLLLFQRRRLWVNPLPHFRWVVAPSILAFAHLLQTVPAPDAAAPKGV